MTHWNNVGHIVRAQLQTTETNKLISSQHARRNFTYCSKTMSNNIDMTCIQFNTIREEDGGELGLLQVLGAAPPA